MPSVGGLGFPNRNCPPQKSPAARRRRFPNSQTSDRNGAGKGSTVLDINYALFLKAVLEMNRGVAHVGVAVGTMAIAG